MSLLLAILLQGDGALKLRLSPVEGATTIDFAVGADTDLPDGVRFRATLYYEAADPSRRIATVVAAVAGGRLDFRVGADAIEPLAGRYVLDLAPDAMQPEDLPSDVRRDLPTAAGTWEARIGSADEAEASRGGVRADLAREISALAAEADRLAALPADADWDTELRATDTTIREIIGRVQKRGEYRLLGLQVLASFAFEDLPGAVRDVGARRREGGAAAELADLVERIRQVRDNYLTRIRIEIRDADAARRGLASLSAALDKKGPMPDDVRRTLIELGWHLAGIPERIERITTLLERHFAGESVRADIEGELDAISSLLDNP